MALHASTASKRIACILVADFSAAALMRANPELRDEPFAIAASYAPHAELCTVSSRGLSAGVRPGMTIAQARSLMPTITVVRSSSAAERSAVDALIDVAQSISPIVEAGKNGVAWLDLSGLERMFRARAEEYNGRNEAPEEVHNPSGNEAEETMAAEIVRRMRRAGMEASVGAASNKEIAYLAARCGGVRIIAPGMEREFLNWLPLDLLDLDAGASGARADSIELKLRRWGIRRLGELARLDAREIGSRLGQRGLALLRIARGESTSPLVARPPAITFSEKTELEYGVDSLEPLAFVMRAMLGRLTERLAMRGLAAGDMTVTLDLNGHRRDARRVAAAAATLDAGAMLTLIRLSLEASPPPDAVEAVQIEVEPRRPRPAQAGMFAPPAPAPDKLQATIARLAALCGPEQVGMILAQDSWRPEAVRIEPFAPTQPRFPSGDRPAKNVTTLVVRAVRPAEEVEVMCTRAMPQFIRGRNLAARVISSAGPWRRQGEWWKESFTDQMTPLRCRDCSTSGACSCHSSKGVTPPSRAGAFIRDYYDLALEDGGVYRIYCDLQSARWFIDGVYD